MSPKERSVGQPGLIYIILLQEKYVSQVIVHLKITLSIMDRSVGSPVVAIREALTSTCYIGDTS